MYPLGLTSTWKLKYIFISIKKKKNSVDNWETSSKLICSVEPVSWYLCNNIKRQKCIQCGENRKKENTFVTQRDFFLCILSQTQCYTFYIRIIQINNWFIHIVWVTAAAEEPATEATNVNKSDNNIRCQWHCFIFVKVGVGVLNSPFTAGLCSGLPALQLYMLIWRSVEWSCFFLWITHIYCRLFILH